MGTVVLFPEVLETDMGISLGCRQVGMAEKFLDATEIRTTLQKMGGKTVA